MSMPNEEKEGRTVYTNVFYQVVSSVAIVQVKLSSVEFGMSAACPNEGTLNLGITTLCPLLTPPST